MSWSLNQIIGTPDKLVGYLNKHSTQLTGASKEEFDAALPNIINIVKLNECDSYPVHLEFSGSGHASFREVEKEVDDPNNPGQKLTVKEKKCTYSQCSVSIKYAAGSFIV